VRSTDLIMGDLNNGKADTAELKELIHRYNLLRDTMRELWTMAALARTEKKKRQLTFKEYWGIINFVRRTAYLAFKHRER
jgi:hypothetical protein